jgi:hypothetical protein
MFVTFFFSDKGRKFFRFFRELMITGKKLDSTLIPSNIAKLFFILNLFIEASYNQTTKSHELFKKINSLTDKLNTNFFIYHIYQIINNKPDSINLKLLFNNNNKLYDIPNIKDAGNPLTYYESILKYLNYDTLKFLKQTFTNNMNVKEVIARKFKSLLNIIPDIIIIEDFQSKSLFETSYKCSWNCLSSLKLLLLLKKDPKEFPRMLTDIWAISSLPVTIGSKSNLYNSGTFKAFVVIISSIGLFTSLIILLSE